MSPSDVVGSLHGRRAGTAPHQPQHDRLRPRPRVGGDPGAPLHSRRARHEAPPRSRSTPTPTVTPRTWRWPTRPSTSAHPSPPSPTSRSERSWTRRSARRPPWCTPATVSCPNGRTSPRRSPTPGSPSWSPTRVDRTDGRQAAARRTADAAGVPITPGTIEPVDPKTTRAEAEKVGFPMVVKAAFGGGGKGMRVVREAAELDEALEGAAREAQSYFGAPRSTWSATSTAPTTSRRRSSPTPTARSSFLGERDCTLQRRHQKLVEETPSPIMDEEMRARLEQASISLAKEVGYINAGTIECIADEDGNFYFMEMNTRLQVEHTVTEMVTGLDLVQLQSGWPGRATRTRGRRARQRSSAGSTPRTRARASCRGPTTSRGSKRPPVPSSGSTRRPQRQGHPRRLRLDVRQAHGVGRRPGEARRRMLRALGEFEVVGVPTTIPFHDGSCRPRSSSTRPHTTTWVERRSRNPIPPPGEPPLRRHRPRPSPSEILVEVNGRRVPVRIYDETLPTPPQGRPRQHASRHGEHVHGEISAPMQGTILRSWSKRARRSKPATSSASWRR